MERAALSSSVSFPLLPLYAAIVALAARGAGRRYGPAVGVLLISVAIARSAVAILLALRATTAEPGFRRAPG